MPLSRYKPTQKSSWIFPSWIFSETDLVKKVPNSQPRTTCHVQKLFSLGQLSVMQAQTKRRSGHAKVKISQKFFQLDFSKLDFFGDRSCEKKSQLSTPNHMSCPKIIFHSGNFQSASPDQETEWSRQGEDLSQLFFHLDFLN